MNKHNLFGDVSADDLKLAQELIEMETYFYEHLEDYGPSICARGLTCVAHDWYALDDDEKGSELLEKANEVCPGYFDNQINQDIENDPEFAYLVKSLTGKILILAKSIVG
jgi:hypothetical protein